MLDSGDALPNSSITSGLPSSLAACSAGRPVQRRRQHRCGRDSQFISRRSGTQSSMLAGCPATPVCCLICPEQFSLSATSRCKLSAALHQCQGLPCKRCVHYLHANNIHTCMWDSIQRRPQSWLSPTSQLSTHLQRGNPAGALWRHRPISLPHLSSCCESDTYPANPQSAAVPHMWITA